MSDVRTQSMVILYWSMLASGAGLSGLGLIRSVARFRERRSLLPEDGGEYVIGDGRLAAGQSIVVAPGIRGFAGDPAGVTSGMVADMSRNQCVLALDSEPPLDNCAPESCISSFRGERPNGLAGGWTRGAQVTVSVTASSEIYRFSSRIRDVVAGPNGTRIVVARPSFLVRIQRRKHARVPFAVPATIEREWTSPDSPSDTDHRALHSTAPIHGTVRDLSGGGLQAHVGGVMGLRQLDSLLRLFQPESTVRVRLPIAGLPQSALLARVVASRRAVTAGGLTLSIACEFLPMPNWERELVIQHVFQCQRELSKNRKAVPHGGQSGLRQ
jgi:c-di-GMP-binding flagellar brake protein YcgR